MRTKLRKIDFSKVIVWLLPVEGLLGSVSNFPDIELNWSAFQSPGPWSAPESLDVMGLGEVPVGGSNGCPSSF